MKTICKWVVVAIALVFMLITDVPLLFVQLVPDAHAILGVRRRTARRTAVVLGSAASAGVAAANPQTADAQQQAAQSASAVPIGTVVPAIPGGCTSVVVNNANYFNFAGVYYQAAFQGNKPVYTVVPKP